MWGSNISRFYCQFFSWNWALSLITIFSKLYKHAGSLLEKYASRYRISAVVWVYSSVLSLRYEMSYQFLFTWHSVSITTSLGTLFYLNYRTYHLSIFTCLQNVALSGHILGEEQSASKVHLTFYHWLHFLEDK